MSDKMSSGRGVTRRGFLTVAVSAIVAGVVAGVGAYFAAPVKEVTKTLERTVTTTMTLAPGAPVTTTVTVTAPPTTVTTTITKTVTPTITVTPTLPLADQVVKIGSVLPLTGAASTMGYQYYRGQQLAVEEINEQGGILGAKVQLLVEDYAGDPKVALSATEKLITVDKVHVITGPTISAAALVMQEVTERHKTPFLCIAAADELAQKGYRYWFRITQSASELTKGTFMFLNEVIKPKTIGIIHDLSLRGVSTKNAFLELAKQYGYEPNFVEGYSVGTLDFKPLIEKMKLADPDVLLFVAYTTDAILLAKQMAELKYKPKAVVVEAGMQSFDFLEPAGTYVKGWFIQTEWWPDRNYPDYDMVFEVGLKYWKRWGKPMDNMAQEGYTHCDILKDAIERAKSLDPTAIRDALAQTDLFLPYLGRVRFGPDGHRIDALATFGVAQVLPAKPETPWQVNGLSFYTVWPEKMKTTEPVYPMPP